MKATFKKWARVTLVLACVLACTATAYAYNTKFSFELSKSFPIFRTIDFCKKAPLLSHLQIPAYTLTELFCKNYTTLQIKSGIAPSVACQIVLKSIVYIVLFCYNWTIYFTQFS